ncbi:MAG: aminoglycoside phosphotransferase family protein [Defluviitaleaceae bacterium]|nr:aminoglycoside phosphotransferase family protein [Defluviitaleaceae bacterium]
MKWANAQRVPAPKLITHGGIKDKYHFQYMIMEYICGKTLGEIESTLNYEDKVSIGKQMRSITDKLNEQCGNFTPVDVMQYAIDNDGWSKEGFPPSFLAERLVHLANMHINESEKVYCHGDWNCDNILLDDKLNVYIIDFADAMYAPVEYELVYIASALFCFEKPYMTGYFGEYDVDYILSMCTKWIPLHAWGHATTKENLGEVAKITSIAVMRGKLYDLIKKSYYS